MLSAVPGIAAGLLIAAFGIQSLSLFGTGGPLLVVSLFIILPFLMTCLYWKGILLSMQRGERFERIYTALTLEQASKQAVSARILAILLILVGTVMIPALRRMEPPALAATTLIVGVLWVAAVFLLQRTARTSPRLKMDVIGGVPAPVAMMPVSGDSGDDDCRERAPSEMRRLLKKDECARKIAQAIGFTILGLFCAIVVPATAGKVFFFSVTIRQIFAISHGLGLQRRLRRGETVELITTCTACRGYVPSVSVVVSAILFALICTVAALVVPILNHLSFDVTVDFALATVGVWWVARYLWGRVLPAPVTRAVLRSPLDSQSAAVGFAMPDSAPLTLDQKAAYHPLSRPERWWTDTPLRQETEGEARR